MLPKIARLKPALSLRGRGVLMVFALALLITPTFLQQAHSQLGDKPPNTGEGNTLNSPKAVVAGPGQRPALPPMAPPSFEYWPQPVGAEKKIQETLDEPTEFDFQDQSLDGIVAKLTEMHGIQFVIDKARLEEESITSDASGISLKLSGISLRSALKILLRQMNLAYLIEDEVMKITTMTEAMNNRPTRTYPVRDLVGNVDVDYQLLSHTIQETLGGPPDDPWVQSDGEGGSVSILPAPGCLVIRQTHPAHDQILMLLRSLRKANAETQAK